MTAVFKYHPWEIRPQAEDRWISLMTSKSRIHGFPFLLWFLKSEKRFAKLLSWTVVFFLLNMHAHAKLLFLRTVFQTLFQISPKRKWKEGKSKDSILSVEVHFWIFSRFNANLKSRFQNSNPHFPITCTLWLLGVTLSSMHLRFWSYCCDSSITRSKVRDSYTSRLCVITKFFHVACHHTECHFHTSLWPYSGHFPSFSLCNKFGVHKLWSPTKEPTIKKIFLHLVF